MIDPGYWIEENVLSELECRKLLLSVDRPGIRAGERNLMSNDAIGRLAADPRLLELGKRISRRTLVPFKATLFNKTSKANWLVAWHQDTALPIEKFRSGSGWSAPSNKAGRLFAQAPAFALAKVLALRMHLDSSTRMNGPLRVIPGLHSYGILNDDKMKELIRGTEAVECLVGRSGVIAMSPWLLHASSKLICETPRRVLHIEYAESLEIGDGIKLALS